MTSSSSTLILAPPPPSRANNNSNTSSNNNPFVRPSDNKPLINGRSGGYATASQANKHEVNIAFGISFSAFYFRFLLAVVALTWPLIRDALIVSVNRQNQDKLFYKIILRSTLVNC